MALATVVGLVTLEAVAVPGLERAREGCFVDPTPAMVFLGLDGICVLAAGALGTYPDGAVDKRFWESVGRRQRRTVCWGCSRSTVSGSCSGTGRRLTARLRDDE